MPDSDRSVSDPLAVCSDDMSSAFFAILLCVAILATVLMGSWIFSFHESDAAGQGMTKGFTVVLDIALLVITGILLLMGGARGGFGGWGWTGIIACLAAAGSQFNALIVLTDLERGERFETPLRLLVPAAMLLMIAFAAMHFYAKPAPSAEIAVAIAAAAVAAILLGLAVPAQSASKARREERNRKWQQARERDQALAAEVRVLPPDAPVSDLLRYTDVPPREESDARQTAIAKIGQHPDRQAHIEAAVASGDVRAFRLLADLNLTVTPEMCQAARNFARTYFERFRPTSTEPTFSSVEDQLNAVTPQLRWLLDGGCDCKPEIAQLEKNVDQYPDPYPKKFFMDYLLDLQGKPRE